MTKWKEYEMAFPSNMLSEMRELIWYCEVCGDYSEYLEGHSSSGLHLSVEVENGQINCRVYDACEGHQTLKRRKSLSPEIAEEFIFMDGRLNDCVMCCPVCHDELKRIALTQAKYEDPSFSGRVPPPSVMFRVTRDMVIRGRRLVCDVKV